MLFDLDTTRPGEAHSGYDVCIAGAGVAGIVLANRLAAAGRRVLLLEAGGLDQSEASQSVYRGESIGRRYFELDLARLRYFGGTSNHWAGFCRPLLDWDYRQHAHIPHSGWPISKSTLDPYLQEACDILEVSADFPVESLPEADGLLQQCVSHQSPPVRLGEKYRQELERSDRIDVFLNASVVGLGMSEDRRHVDSVICANYAEPQARYAFRAPAYVVAMGGVENARMLLNFRDQNPGAFDGMADSIGRYFMEHVHLVVAHYVTEPGLWPYPEGIAGIMLAPEARQKAQIANAHLDMSALVVPKGGFFGKAKQRLVCAEDMVRDFVQTFYDVWCPIPAYVGGAVNMSGEQTPNPDSRVLLSDERDRYGLRRVALDWRLNELDRRTMGETAARLGVYLARRKLGNVKLADWIVDGELPVPGVEESEAHGAGWHHMGTTRMAGGAADGVVDRNCKVFGVENLYIAGSSVFATGGSSAPTLTITQLALRLADHLASA